MIMKWLNFNSIIGMAVLSLLFYTENVAAQTDKNDTKQKIDTIDQLDYKENMAKYQLDSYIKERRCIYNKIRRCRNPATKQLYQKDVASLSADIKELRKEVMLYEGIRKRSVTMKEKLHQIYEQERQEQKQPFRKQETMKGV